MNIKWRRKTRNQAVCAKETFRNIDHQTHICFCFSYISFDSRSNLSLSISCEWSVLFFFSNEPFTPAILNHLAKEKNNSNDNKKEKKHRIKLILIALFFLLLRLGVVLSSCRFFCLSKINYKPRLSFYFKIYTILRRRLRITIMYMYILRFDRVQVLKSITRMKRTISVQYTFAPFFSSRSIAYRLAAYRIFDYFLAERNRVSVVVDTRSHLFIHRTVSL